MKKHKVWLKVLFFAAILLTSPHDVFANDNEGENDLIFAEDDILLQGIRGLVGSAANIIVGEDTPSEPDHLIAELMLTYNFGLMAFATIFMLFRGAKWCKRCWKWNYCNTKQWRYGVFHWDIVWYRTVAHQYSGTYGACRC